MCYEPLVPGAVSHSSFWAIDARAFRLLTSYLAFVKSAGRLQREPVDLCSHLSVLSAAAAAAQHRDFVGWRRAETKSLPTEPSKHTQLLLAVRKQPVVRPLCEPNWYFLTSLRQTAS